MDDNRLFGYYPHLNPRVENKPDTFNTPEARTATARNILGLLPGSGEAISAQDAWSASGRAGNALMGGNYGEAASEYGNMLLGVMGAIPGAGVLARGTQRGAAWMDRNLPSAFNRLLDNAMPSDPKNTLNIFAGPVAKAADHGALAKAQELAGSGAGREDIWNQTGWFQGTDGKWRFEIDDSASKLAGEKPAVDAFGYLTGTEGAPVTKFSGLDHPELKAAYDDLDPYRFEGYHAPELPESGVYNPGTGGMEVMAPNPDAARSVTLHEFQHKAQGREDFARGANPDFYVASGVSSPEIKAASEALSSLKPDTPAYTAAMDELMRKQRELAFDMYRRTAGEVEARNVQTRMNMTVAERRAKAPWLTQDVPDDQQIVRYR
jgi:hypothetical protein